MPNPLLARFAGEPTLVAPERRDRFEACLDAVMAIEHGPAMLRDGASADDGFWPEPGSWKAGYRPYIVVDGVLQIPVKGVLLHDFAYAVGGFVTGYVYIRRAFERGMADATVKGIALICDSPGGEVAGCFDLVDAMRAAKGRKPIWAFAHEAAYSAAYAVASVADRIWVSRTGGVGSIGVVTAHTDVSAALEQRGVKVTFIFAGKHKVDGNAYQPLPADVEKRIQARIDGLYDVFVATVARNRPALKEKAVRATEALCFSADEAITNGLADAVGSPDDAAAAFAADLNPPEEEDDTMITPEAHEAAVAAARADGKRAGRAQGAIDERARVTAILDDESSKGREAAARHVALATDMDAEAAKGLLASLPSGQSEPRSSAAVLAERMATRTPLALEPENPEASQKRKASLDTAAIYAARRKKAA